jgi:hypothetical protein
MVRSTLVRLAADADFQAIGHLLTAVVNLADNERVRRSRLLLTTDFSTEVGTGDPPVWLLTCGLAGS